MTRPTCATCSHQTGAKSCGHLLAETGETVWCPTIAECGFFHVFSCVPW